MTKRHYAVLFITAGLLFVSVGVIFDMKGLKPYDTIPFTFGTTLLAIVLVNYLWENSGGEPIRNSLDVLSRATQVVSDSIETGLRRVHHTRRSINYEDWHPRIATAKTVYFMSLVLKVDQSLDLKRSLLECVRAGGRVRILLSDPDIRPRMPNGLPSPLLLRQYAEQDVGNNRMQAEVKDTIDFFKDIEAEIRRQWPNRLPGFEMRLVSDYVIYWSLTRIDDTMLVTHYCNKRQGLGCPTFVLEQTSGSRSLFAVYAEEFEFLWKKSGPQEPGA